MGEQITRHQLFEYQDKEPCIIYNENIPDDSNVHYLNHWHKELEIAYIAQGRTRHYIDGKCIQGIPGRVIVTNSECIHNVIFEELPSNENELGSVVILIREDFLNRYFPEYQQIYFTNESEQASQPVIRTILELSEYAKVPTHAPQDYLYLNGLLLHLLFHLYNDGVCRRTDNSEQRNQKNTHRLKEVLQYIEENYAEPISQKDLAERFFFNQSHLSRTFRQCLGITFTDYLTGFRLNKARIELLETNDSILDIALRNGFGDSRSFINAFKKIYGQPPFQYRKRINGLK